MSRAVVRKLWWGCLIVALLAQVACGEPAVEGEGGPDAEAPNPFDELDDPPVEDEESCAAQLLDGVCMPATPVMTPAEECPGGLFDEDGICAPLPPRLLPAEGCPEGAAPGSDGICAPAAPRLRDWTCPEGWLSVPVFVDGDGQEDAPAEIGQIAACEPPPLAQGCAPGTMSALGQSACVPQGAACPPEGERWRDEASIRASAEGFEGPILYVSPEGDGDGTRQAPAAWAGAIERVGEGGIVALAVGTYAEPVEVLRRAALVGACVEGTILSPSAPSSTSPTIKFSGGGQGLVSDLTVTGPRPGVRFIGHTGQSRLKGVRVDQATVYGVEVVDSPGPVELIDVIVRDTQPKASDRAEGGGLRVLNRGEVSLSRSILEGNRYLGVELLGRNARLSMADVAVVDTQPRASDRTAGLAMQGSSGAQVDIERALFDGNHGQSLVFFRPDTEARLIDVVVRRTQPDAATRGFGRGLSAEGGAHVVVERGLFDANREVAISSQQEGSLIELRDVLVRDTQSQHSDFTFGIGLNAIEGGRLVAERAVLLRNRAYGALAIEGGVLELDDVVVIDTREQEQGKDFGRGIGAQSAGRITLRRGLMVGNRLHGVFGTHRTSLDIEDLIVRDTRPRASDGALGIGLGLSDGASLTLSRARFERNRFGAIVVEHGPEDTAMPPTQARMSDVLALDTLPQDSDARFGRGLFVQKGASVALSRARIVGSHYIGAHAIDPGTTLTLEDVIVEGTQPRQTDLKFGQGLRAEDGAVVSATRVELNNNHEIGLMALVGAQVTLEDVVIRGTRPQQSGGLAGRGLYVEQGSRVQGRRLALLENHEIAIYAVDADTEVSLTDLRVADTLSQPFAGIFGRGLNAEFHARVTLHRAAFVQNREIAVFASQWSHLELSDLVVRDTQPRSGDQIGGRALNLQDGATGSVRRALIRDNLDYGVVLLDDETALEAEDLTILDTKEARCESIACPWGKAGTGMSVVLGATASLDRFFIAGSDQVGLQLALDASLDSRHGAITSNNIGVNLQIEEFNIQEAFEDVRSFDNGVDFDAQDIAPPNAAAALDALESAEDAEAAAP